jgi:N-formylglutamate deformylase
MRAHFPRAFLDVNREPYELDPRMFDGRLPAFANTRSLRVAGGLGTIARVVGDAREIYDRRLPVDEALNRIELFYKPYHRTLRQLIVQAQRRFGAAVLLDCHSMPSSANGREERPRADVVLGDRYGTSCAPAVTDVIDESLRASGYLVIRNKPYAGGFITEHYGDPAAGQHAVQIEINRALYMDEHEYRKSANFAAVRSDLGSMVRRLAEATVGGISPLRDAAE